VLRSFCLSPSLHAVSGLKRQQQRDTPAIIAEFRARIQWVLYRAMATPSDFRGALNVPLSSADEELRTASRPCGTLAVRAAVLRALHEP